MKKIRKPRTQKRAFSRLTDGEQHPVLVRERPAPGFEVPQVYRIDSVRHSTHYRTTLLSMPTPVFVTYTRLEQVGHEHFFADLTRFGDASCASCGAEAWAAMWVADGVFGEGTHEWLTGQARRHEDLVEGTVLDLLHRELGAEVIAEAPAEAVAVLADLNPSNPARSPFGPVQRYGYKPKHKATHLSVVRD